MTPPELVLINADIRTMDPHFPRVSALAVRHGRVAALGNYWLEALPIRDL